MRLIYRLTILLGLVYVGAAEPAEAAVLKLNCNDGFFVVECPAYPDMFCQAYGCNGSKAMCTNANGGGHGEFTYRVACNGMIE